MGLLLQTEKLDHSVSEEKTTCLDYPLFLCPEFQQRSLCHCPTYLAKTLWASALQGFVDNLAIHIKLRILKLKILFPPHFEKLECKYFLLSKR
jgi:hypothetical protein